MNLQSCKWANPICKFFYKLAAGEFVEKLTYTSPRLLCFTFLHFRCQLRENGQNVANDAEVSN